MKLIDDYKLALRFWSIRLGLLGTAITSVLIAWPEAALFAWNTLPDDLKSSIPQQFVYFIGVFVFVMSMFARVIKQTQLEQPISTTTQEKQHE